MPSEAHRIPTFGVLGLVFEDFFVDGTTSFDIVLLVMTPSKEAFNFNEGFFREACLQFVVLDDELIVMTEFVGALKEGNPSICKIFVDGYGKI